VAAGLQSGRDGVTRLAGHQWEGTGSGFDMTVDGYSFGEISIDGKPYTKGSSSGRTM
jgi:hypothetical protein